MTIAEQMMELLADGMPHTRRELHAFCGPSRLSVVRKHICVIRRDIRPRGEDIICVLYRRALCYQHVRLLGSSRE